MTLENDKNRYSVFTVKEESIVLCDEKMCLHWTRERFNELIEAIWEYGWKHLID